MMKLTCPNCGSNDFEETGEYYRCNHCGTVQIKPRPFPKKRIALIITLLLAITLGIIMAYKLLYSVKKDIVDIKQHTPPATSTQPVIIKPVIKPVQIEPHASPFADIVQKVESRYGQQTRFSTLEKALNHYYAQEKHKALYIAIDKDGRYVTAISYAAATPRSAEDTARERCEKKRKAHTLKSTCIPYALDDHISRQLLKE